MAKMTLTDLQNFVKTYVDAAKQAGTWQASTDNMYRLQDKIGRMVTLKGNYQDKLPELDGNELPLGKTIEEYFIDLVMPIDKDMTEGKFAENALKPYLPTVQDPSYNYTLGEKVIPVTKPYNNFERAAIDTASAASLATDIEDSFANSTSMYKFALKKQLLGNMIKKVIEADDEKISTIERPTDSASGEVFIKEVKKVKETAEFANENNCLSNALIGATPEDSLVLYIKKGVMPSLEVDTMTGAYHLDKLAIPCKVKVVDDFGDADASVYAVMVDSRGVKLCQGYQNTMPQPNGYAGHISLFRHLEYTGFISKFTFVHVFKSEA